MSIFEGKIHTDNLHHAYIIIGDRNIIQPELVQFLEDALKITAVGNPDFSLIHYTTVTIDDARALALLQTHKDFGSEHKIFLIAAHTITEEAQNALLKIFEEPTPGTHFFMIASQNNFLPTFLSRVQLIHTFAMSGETTRITDMPIADRLVIVGKLVSDITDEKKTKQDAIDLVNNLERELASDVVIHAVALRACESARSQLLSRGAMIKMILENLMLQV